jgi:hypothetical protein
MAFHAIFYFRHLGSLPYIVSPHVLHVSQYQKMTILIHNRSMMPIIVEPINETVC